MVNFKILNHVLKNSIEYVIYYQNMSSITRVKNPWFQMARWGIFSLILFWAGCRGCTPEQLAQNLGNGNDDPEVLIVETWGTEIRNALSSNAASRSGGFGFDCLGKTNFIARVNVEVRTASLVNGQITPDPILYYDMPFPNESFFNNTGSNDGTQIEISVPETGAYALIFEVELDECSNGFNYYMESR